jgi:nucleotide-binding universal stress UspA family protein
MSYKTILVHVDGSPHVRRRVEIAARLAALYDAHLIGVAVAAPAILFDPLTFSPLDPAIEPLLQRPRERAADALANFDSIARQFHVGSIETRLEETEDARGISLQARYCDLVVLGQHDPDDTESSVKANFAETMILECGVPVLMVPYASALTNTGRRALVSWNASKEAVRAVHDALPLLQGAAQVDVAVFDPDTMPATHRAVPDKDILDWLARHAVAAKVTRQLTAGDIDIGNGLLSLATDLASDLLVMGGYGHTRLRELVMGGVTRHILKSMTLPTLMAH